MRTFGDYLVDANIYDLIENSRITKYDESQFENNYYQGLTMKNMYYSNKINHLKSKAYHFEKEIINEQRASMRTRNMLSIIEKENLRTGAKLHEKFEYADFKKLRYSDDPMLRALGEAKFSDKLIEDAKSVVHEYQFFDDERKLNGTIDLLVIYDDEIHIVDYKTREIDSSKYFDQLNKYKEYISSVYKNIRVKTYLYSIALNKIEKINLDN
jgi:ATP-dependent helicase/nuclease subunit A